MKVKIAEALKLKKEQEYKIYRKRINHLRYLRKNGMAQRGNRTKRQDFG